MLPGDHRRLPHRPARLPRRGLHRGPRSTAYGNLNTSAIGGYDRPKVRLPGTGGANDIISLCRG
jgi:hypothetical protein